MSSASLCVVLALLSSPLRADCPLAFAPLEIREAARRHYYQSPKRHSLPPGDPLALQSAPQALSLKLPAVPPQPAVQQVGCDPLALW